MVASNCMNLSSLKQQEDKRFLTSYVMRSYPPRALDRRLQEDWARDVGEGPRILMSLRVDFGRMG